MHIVKSYLLLNVPSRTPSLVDQSKADPIHWASVRCLRFKLDQLNVSIQEWYSHYNNTLLLILGRNVLLKSQDSLPETIGEYNRDKSHACSSAASPQIVVQRDTGRCGIYLNVMLELNKSLSHQLFSSTQWIHP